MEAQSESDEPNAFANQTSLDQVRRHHQEPIQEQHRHHAVRVWAKLTWQFERALGKGAIDLESSVGVLI